MKWLILFILYVPIIQICNAKDSLQYFIKHRKLVNSTIRVLSNFSMNTNKRWIEYKHIFDNTNDSYMRKVPKESRREIDVGYVPVCDTSRKANQSCENGELTYDVLETLEHFINYRINRIMFNNSENLRMALFLKNIDAVICHSSEENIIQTNSILKSKYTLIYKPSKFHFTRDIFVLTFAGSLWFVFVATLILLAACLRITTLRYSLLYQSHEVWTWVDITLWAIATACQQGLSYTPRGLASRTIFFMGYVMAYMSYTGFTAAITSLLVQHGNSYLLDLTKISRFHLIAIWDLKSDTKCLEDKFQAVTYAKNIGEMFEYLDKYGNIGVAPEIHIQQFMHSSQFSEYREQTKYAKIKMDISYHYGLGVLSNSTLRKLIHEGMQRLEEVGILDRILNRYNKPTLISEVTSEYSSAGKEHVGSAIFLLLTGILASLVFLLVESMYTCYQNHKQNI